MNADIRPIKTKAEQGLAQAFSTAKATLPGNGRIAALRAAAFEYFDTRGLPHRRVEEWKYTDLRALMRDAKPLPPPPDAATKRRAKDAGKLVGDVDCRRLVFADGAFIAELSDLADLEAGLTIQPMAHALSKGDAEVLAHLGKIFPADDDVAVALNTAFMGDGAVIRVAAGTIIERPLHLIFAAAGDKPAAMYM